MLSICLNSIEFNGRNNIFYISRTWDMEDIVPAIKLYGIYGVFSIQHHHHQTLLVTTKKNTHDNHSDIIDHGDNKKW